MWRPPATDSPRAIVFVDALAVGLAVTCAYIARALVRPQYSLGEIPSVLAYAVPLGIVAVVAAFALSGLYRDETATRADFRRIAGVTALAFALVILAASFFAGEHSPRLILLPAFGFSLAFLLLGRKLYGRVRRIRPAPG